MSDDNLTPYERTYGAPLSKQPAPVTPAAQPAPAGDAAPAAEQAAPAAQPAPEAPAEAAGEAPSPATPPPPTASPVAPPPPPSATPAATTKRKAWPWVVLACAIALVLLVGGCASCAVIGTIAALDDYPDRHMQDPNSEYDPSFGGHDDDSPYSYDEWDDLLDEYGYDFDDLTFEDILSMTDLDEGSYQGSSFGEGVYKVGNGGLEPGLYYLGGSQDAIGWYLTFDLASHAGQDTYDLDDTVIYMGNYFTELKKGDVIAFMPPAGADATMRLATDEPLDVSAPYQSGCYRVGIDIPAGTYAVTIEPTAAGVLEDEGDEPGAFVMSDLEFGRSSIIKEARVIAGGKQTVTVKDGQYLELIGAQATPQG